MRARKLLGGNFIGKGEQACSFLLINPAATTVRVPCASRSRNDYLLTCPDSVHPVLPTAASLTSCFQQLIMTIDHYGNEGQSGKPCLLVRSDTTPSASAEWSCSGRTSAKQRTWTDARHRCMSPLARLGVGPRQRVLAACMQLERDSSPHLSPRGVLRYSGSRAQVDLMPQLMSCF